MPRQVVSLAVVPRRVANDISLILQGNVLVAFLAVVLHQAFVLGSPDPDATQTLTAEQECQRKTI